MHKLNLYLSSFRLCRRKTKSPVMNNHLFSPFNPKALEITYPTTPSPPPTTPIYQGPHITTTRESLNSPASFDTKSSSDKSTKMTKRKKNNIGSGDDVKKNGGIKVSKINKDEESTLTFVKWSDQPYDDFKRSMLEMIMEKEMFDAKDLEQLLQSFLTLNSRHHHADIIAAFTEIWELLFA